MTSVQLKKEDQCPVKEREENGNNVSRSKGTHSALSFKPLQVRVRPGDTVTEQGVHPSHAQQSQTLTTQFGHEEIGAVCWQGTRPGDRQADAQNPNSPVVFHRGSLRQRLRVRG